MTKFISQKYISEGMFDSGTYQGTMQVKKYKNHYIWVVGDPMNWGNSPTDHILYFSDYYNQMMNNRGEYITAVRVSPTTIIGKRTNKLLKGSKFIESGTVSYTMPSNPIGEHTYSEFRGLKTVPPQCYIASQLYDWFKGIIVGFAAATIVDQASTGYKDGGAVEAAKRGFVATIASALGLKVIDILNSNTTRSVVRRR